MKFAKATLTAICIACLSPTFGEHEGKRRILKSSKGAKSGKTAKGNPGGKNAKSLAPSASPSISVSPSSEPSSSPSKAVDRIVDHIVIGLGFAGTELATLLSRDGKTFEAFEAGPTHGGRVKMLDFGGYALPAGAGWQHGGGPQHVLTSRLQECGIQTQPTNSKSTREYDYNGNQIYGPWEEFDAAYGCASMLSIEMQINGEPDVDARALLARCGWFPETIEEHLVDIGFLDTGLGESSSATSAFAILPNHSHLYPHTAGDNLIVDPKGYQELAGCWLDKYVGGGRNGPSLHYNSAVIKIDSENKIITLQDGTRIGWRDALFDTRSLAVHQYDVAKNNGQGFTPPLDDERVSAMMLYHFPSTMKVFFQFPEKFWDDTELYFIFSSNGLRSSNWGNLDLPGFFPGSRILYNILPEAHSIELLSDEEITRILMEDLVRVFDLDTTPVPENVHVTRWGQDPYFRGAYSNRSPSLSQERFEQIFAPFGADNSVVFTGETYCRRMNGYVHGAVLAAQTSYDEWKVRQGDSPFLRDDPRDNTCFTAEPTTGPEGDSLRLRDLRKLAFNSPQFRQRFEHLNHGQTNRLSDADYWKEVDRRIQIARSHE